VEKLIRGIHQFRADVFGRRQELFARLAQGQSPLALFITCSDSRISPTLITQTDPGDLFVLRNAGNILPAHQAIPSGEEATVEFALGSLGIRDIIVCGHTCCGAMAGLFDHERTSKLPAVQQWLRHADATYRIITEKYQHLPQSQIVKAAAQENVLVQLEHLKTYPAVAAGLAKGDVNLHGWMYKMETGEVFTFDLESGQFIPVEGNEPKPVRSPRLQAPTV
jgi:carbonic anhydrase